ncbi:predicted protein [Nematostella vectensis]|uniref:G-protein coupled receptors family 1 profile domain-containing protein n=1 Tax=Nematostella vectensis TaxID=45351 RepID=A7RSR4_NEMVE|nr:predicted protein [Nematostella vectensis]|eukprot:XP_001637568.1 predicted protein [Nematostella vectensis]
MAEDERQIENIIIAIYVCLSVFGFFGNIFVFLDIHRKRSARRTTNDYLLLHLAIGDLMLVCCSVLTSIFRRLELYPVCLYITMAILITRYLGVFTLTLIAIERHRTLTSVLQLVRLRRRFVMACIPAVWVISALFSSPIMWIKNIGPVECRNNITTKDITYAKSFYMFLFMTQFVIPFTVILILYYKTAAFVHNNQPRDAHGDIPSAFRSRLGFNDQRNRRVYKTLFAMLTLFAVCSVPQYVVYIWSEFFEGYKKPLINADVYLLTFSLVFVNSALDPVLYGTLRIKWRTNFCFACFRNKYTSGSMFWIARSRPSETLPGASRKNPGYNLKIQDQARPRQELLEIAGAKRPSETLPRASRNN